MTFGSRKIAEWHTAATGQALRAQSTFSLGEVNWPQIKDKIRTNKAATKKRRCDGPPFILSSPNKFFGSQF